MTTDLQKCVFVHKWHWSVFRVAFFACDYHAFGAFPAHSILIRWAKFFGFCFALCLVGVVPSKMALHVCCRDKSHAIIMHLVHSPPLPAYSYLTTFRGCFGIMCIVRVVPSFSYFRKWRRRKPHLIYFITYNMITYVASNGGQTAWVFNRPAKMYGRTQMAMFRIPYSRTVCEYHASGGFTAHPHLVLWVTFRGWLGTIFLVGVAPSFHNSLKLRRNKSHLIYVTFYSMLTRLASYGGQITWLFRYL